MAVKGDTAKKPEKGGIERNVNANHALCCCPLKIKFGEFKHFHAKTLQGL